MAARGRPKKYPDLNPEQEREELINTACKLAREPFDDRQERNISLPTIASIATALHTTTAKTRKLFISGGYYTSVKSREVGRLREAGLSVKQIAEKMGLSTAFIAAYLPYSKGSYNLEEPSQDSMHSKKVRERKAAVAELQDGKSSIALWKAVIAFQDYSFTTSGRGGRQGVKFEYKVSSGGPSGRKYEGEEVEGWGNEMFIINNEGVERKKVFPAHLLTTLLKLRRAEK